MKKKLLDRRGAAIELAIMMMVFSIFITTIVLTTALLQNTHKAKAELGIKQDIFLEQLGEDFVDAVVNGGMNTDWDPGEYEDITFVDTTEPHNFGPEETIEATCTEKGKVIKVCLECGQEESIREISEKGHNTGIIDCHNGKVACEDCGELVMVEHNWIPNDLKAICDGRLGTECVCSKCGDVGTVDFLPLGHIWKENISTPATCNEDGEMTHICERCSKRCDEEGSEQRICKEGLEKHIVPKEHQSWIVVSEKEDGCKTITIYECSQEGCGRSTRKEIETAHHVFGTEPIETIPSTCTVQGKAVYKCTAEECNVTNEEKLPLMAHSFNGNGVCTTEDCTARRNHYIRTVITAGKDAYKLHIQGIDAVENPQGIPEGSTDVIDACGKIVLKITLEWSATDNVYKITEWSKK